MLELALTDGPAPLLLTGDVMRNAASALIADPDSAALLLHLHTAVDAGEVGLISRLLSKFYTPGAPESFSIMPLAMDVASGIGAARLEQVNREAQTSLLGDVLNHPMPHLAGALGLDLGDEFRTPPVSDIPTLVLSGTLDGRTYPESQREAVARMSNVSIVTVVNAGHNLFMTTPEVTQTIQRFMRGEKITDAEITVDVPDFTKTPDLPW
jgi:pimeloyl-ACP methyl ester carboxylesterase